MSPGQLKKTIKMRDPKGGAYSMRRLPMIDFRIQPMSPGDHATLPSRHGCGLDGRRVTWRFSLLGAKDRLNRWR